MIVLIVKIDHRRRAIVAPGDLVDSTTLFERLENIYPMSFGVNYTVDYFSRLSYLIFQFFAGQRVQ